MQNCDAIATVRSTCDLDHWYDFFMEFHGLGFGSDKNIHHRNVKIMICKIAKWSEPSDQVLIRTVDPTPFRGIRDRDLESRDASSPDSQNTKSQKRLRHKVVVTTLGYISERWRKELEQPSSVSGIATENVEMHGHMNVELANAEMLKWMQNPMESIQRCRWIWTRSEGNCSTT